MSAGMRRTYHREAASAIYAEMEAAAQQQHKPVGLLGCLLCGRWIGDESVHDTSEIIWREAVS